MKALQFIQIFTLSALLSYNIINIEPITRLSESEQRVQTEKSSNHVATAAGSDASSISAPVMKVAVTVAGSGASNISAPMMNVAVTGSDLLNQFKDQFTGGGMNRPEQELLARTYADADSVFEWGMGSSTLIAAHVGVERLTAVDSAPTWIEMVSTVLQRPTYTLRHADIGSGVEFGNPKDQTRKAQWPDYSLQVDREEAPFDAYLVDGQFPVACACRALLHGRPGSLVLVHDFGRGEYQVLLTLAEKVEQERVLAVLRRKTTTSDTDISAVWEKYKFVPAQVKFGTKEINSKKTYSFRPDSPGDIGLPQLLGLGCQNDPHTWLG